MKTLSLNTHWNRSSTWARGLAIAALAAGAWALSAGNAQARGDDVYWSIGVNSPGVSVGVSNAPTVVVHPRPVMVHQYPVMVHQPYPYVVGRPVVVVPQPVYYQPVRGHGPRWDERRARQHHKWHKRHERQERHAYRDPYDRHDRHDYRGDGEGRRSGGRH